MFINLSNHPLCKWSDGQLAAAKKISDTIAEYPFPIVDPHWSIDRIRMEADKIVRDIIVKYGKEGTVVHVMGEFNLAFAVVAGLQSAGIRCLASCTDRITEDMGNGTKLSRFEFVQFREYIQLNSE